MQYEIYVKFKSVHINNRRNNIILLSKRSKRKIENVTKKSNMYQDLNLYKDYGLSFLSIQH